MVKMWAMLMVFFVLNLSNHGGFAKPQVPCYFIFGDSLVDNGNNNDLVSLAKANFFPYGIDFPQGPTGRFCNGRTTVDVITELLGFDDYIPSYATQRRRDILKFRGMDYASAAAAQLLDLVDVIKTYVGFHHKILKGVNYGSGAAGILDESGKTQGDRISMNEQLIHHRNIVRRIALILGGKRAAERYLNKCIYSVTMGSNDYVNNYYLPQAFDSSDLYSPEQFAEVLIKQYSPQLQSLYKFGARKVVVFGVGQIGFTPIEISQHGNEYPTIYDMNDAAILFNVKLKALIDDFNLNLPGAKFTFISDPGVKADESIGFTETITPCCSVGSNNDTCAPNTIPCQNRKEYVFFDNIHPSEALNIHFGNAYYNATTTDAYPYTIAQLAHLE